MDSLDPSEFELRVLKDRGFVRKRCKVCGTYFWTKDLSRETCGEAPCDPYTFMDTKKFNSSYTVSSMREYFLKFFEKRGHTRIAPRPVVARWRDDLYLTSASIVLFQPYVTTGMIPPPANPLVVSQPCIRFVDIDRVGLTAGRHLTMFEMGGAHAFNSEDNWKYWKDETVAYGLDFLESLGVKEEEITLKEDFWEGGGNAGPAFEVILGGLELETLVFMKFVEKNGKYEEMPMKIVDTGYGIERFAWVSQGTPTAFEAIFPDLLPKFMKFAGIEMPSRQLLSDMAKASIYALGDQTQADKLMAKAMGMSDSEFQKKVKPFQQIGALLDHTKTIAFLLSDGVIPSNAGEGYLARLILRRALRLKWLLDIKVPLKDLVALQIQRWKDDFPSLADNEQRILELVGIEEAKYNEALQKGLGVLQRRIGDLGKVDNDLLMKLYDSYGVPIEVIIKALSDKGIKADIPADFYSNLASLHSSAPKGQLGQKSAKVVPHEEVFSALTPTRPLYYETRSQAFQGNVLSYYRFQDGEFIVLDKTGFYPEGGGQPSDTGVLSWSGGTAKVIKAYKTPTGTIVHQVIVEGKPPEVGSSVSGQVDWERRKQLMRGHTATHLVLAAARTVLGSHVWQMGAQKGVDINRLDLLHYKPVSGEELRRIEGLANAWVMDNIKVEVLDLERDLAEAAFGYRIYQGGVVPGKRLRVVRIGEVDVEACGGTHVDRTGEIGQIKLTSVSRIQESIFRFEFRVGSSSIEYVEGLEANLTEAASYLSTSKEGFLQKLSSTLSELNTCADNLDEIKKSLAQKYIDSAVSLETSLGKVRVVALNDELEPRNVAIQGTSTSDVVAVIAKNGKKLAIASRRGSGIDLHQFAAKLQEAGGKGGGSGELLEFVFSSPINDGFLSDFFKNAIVF